MVVFVVVLDRGNATSDGRTLAEKMIGNKSVRSLLLYNGRLGDKGAMAIGATLAARTGAVVQTLGIGNNGVGPRGAAALGKALAEKHCHFQQHFGGDQVAESTKRSG